MRRLLKTTLILVIVALFLLSGALGILQIMSNSVTLDTTLLPQALAEPVFYADNGARMNYEISSAIEPEDIPQNLKNAFIALEDKRFYKHNGYDVKRIFGAVAKNIKAGTAKEGASTITQQLIKNTHLTSEKTLSRKVNEVFLATKLEKQYTKDEILAMYLSVIYFGGGIYGVKDAAKYYFDKELKDLSVIECATLAGIVKNPAAYSPKNNLDKSTERRNLVLKLMNEQGMIDETQLNTSLSETTKVVNTKTVITGEQAYLKQCVREVLNTLDITRFQLENSGMKIYTHYNPSAQALLVKEIRNKANYAENNIDGAGALIDNNTCGVIAYYSTIPYSFRRQAGSVIKPIVAYAPALERGLINIASPIEDAKTDFFGYSPSNFNDVYYGWTTPREAIKKSMNTVAVKALSYIGSDVGMEYGRKFGLTLNDKDNTLALALGGLTDGVTVLEMAGAYATLANSGQFSTPKFVRYTVAKNGDILYANDRAQNQIISKENSAILTDVLIDTATDGTAKTLSTLPFMVASKTGTVGSPSHRSSDKPNTDAWNLSYTTKHTLAIWHGGAFTSETGGGYPTMTARNVLKEFYNKEDNTTGNANPADFVLPDTVKEVEIDDYALQNEQRVLLVGENTPEKFIKKELFSLFNMPIETSDIFSKIIIENFDVELVSTSNSNYRKTDKNGNENGTNDDHLENDEGYENNKIEKDNEYDFIEETFGVNYTKNKTHKDELDFGNPYDDFDFEVPQVYFNEVKVSFDAKDIFTYKVEREINGERELIATIKDSKKKVVVLDTPHSFECYATYIVTPMLITDTECIIGEAQSETIWLSFNW